MLKFAPVLQPAISSVDLGHVFDSLELNSCNITRPPPAASPPPSPPASPTEALFVDYENGSDAASGSEKAPLKTVAKALEAVAAKKALNIVLRAGVHLLSATLELTPAHSGSTLTAYCSGDTFPPQALD